jgi:radical SAM protein with 4Fe4S-binding SPASM domain
VFLTTNGSVAWPEKVEAVMAAGLDSLKFSYNHSGDKQFRAITGCSPEKFEAVKQNIKEAHAIRERAGYNTRLYASSIMYDGEQKDQMSQSIERIKPYVDEHYYLPLLSFGDQARIEGKDAVVGNPGRLDAMRPPTPCWAVFREGHVTHDGLMSACCFDSSNRWIMGDLKEHDFMSVWNSEEYQNLRKAHLTHDVHGTACETCIHGEG